jgi:glutathione synthase/RimK-type ligase-like ATP-grasp enzyme
MIQDELQMALYEDKSTQHQFFHPWMPRTWRLVRKADALKLLENNDTPEVLVSKADVGASSVNVRILKSRDAQRAHIEQLFGEGIEVNHCAGGAKSLQQGYALLQEFIPHQVTWRVNIVGTKLAAFKRYCYPDREVAQTGNVEPVKEMDAEIESLFDYANAFFRSAGTHWCAADILKDGDKWRLLETSLAWPWPSPGDCDNAPFFGTKRRWREMWDVMFDEFETGVWL